MRALAEWKEHKGPTGIVDGFTLYFGHTSIALVTLGSVGQDGRRYRGPGAGAEWRGDVWSASKRACLPVVLAATADPEADLERVKQEVLNLACGPIDPSHPPPSVEPEPLIFWTQRKAFAAGQREAPRGGYWLTWREGYKWAAAPCTPNNIEAAREKPDLFGVDRQGWLHTRHELEVKLARASFYRLAPSSLPRGTHEH